MFEFISRYLADKGLFSAELYPKDLLNRARIDEFLSWHHLTLRAGCGYYFRRAWLMPLNGLADKPTPEHDAKLISKMEEQLELLEKIWLKDTNFLAGQKLTAADLFGASEIEQTSKFLTAKICINIASLFINLKSNFLQNFVSMKCLKSFQKLVIG